MREAAAFVLLACACGMAARTPVGVAAAGRATAASPPTSDAVPVANRFESIEARGPSIAPGMRAAVRRESTGEKIELVRAEQRDTCVRVAFEATVPVVAKLVDGTDRALAETGSASIDGVLGEKGPVCIRKGETLSVLVTGARAPIRWVGWVAP